jgi:hypothetical protein
MVYELRLLFAYLDDKDRDTIFRVCKLWRSQYLWVCPQIAFIRCLCAHNKKLAGEIWSFSGPFGSLPILSVAIRYRDFKAIDYCINQFDHQNCGMFANMINNTIKEAVEKQDIELIRVLAPKASKKVIKGALGRSAYAGYHDVAHALCDSRPDMMDLLKQPNFHWSRESIEFLVIRFGFDIIGEIIDDTWKFYLAQIACRKNNVEVVRKYWSNDYHAEIGFLEACKHDSYDVLVMLISDPKFRKRQISFKNQYSERVKDLLHKNNLFLSCQSLSLFKAGKNIVEDEIADPHERLGPAVKANNVLLTLKLLKVIGELQQSQEPALGDSSNTNTNAVDESVDHSESESEEHDGTFTKLLTIWNTCVTTVTDSRIVDALFTASLGMKTARYDLRLLDSAAYVLRVHHIQEYGEQYIKDWDPRVNLEVPLNHRLRDPTSIIIKLLDADNLEAALYMMDINRIQDGT